MSAEDTVPPRQDSGKADHVDAVVSGFDGDSVLLSCTLGGEPATLRVASARLPPQTPYGGPVRLSHDDSVDPPALSISARESVKATDPEVLSMMAWVDSL